MTDVSNDRTGECLRAEDVQQGPRIATIKEVVEQPPVDGRETLLLRFEELEGGLIAAKQDVFDAIAFANEAPLERYVGKKVVIYDEGEPDSDGRSMGGLRVGTPPVEERVDREELLPF